MVILTKIRLNIISASEMKKAENDLTKLEGTAEKIKSAKVTVKELRSKRKAKVPPTQQEIIQKKVGKSAIKTLTPEEKTGIFADRTSNTPIKSKDKTSKQAVDTSDNQFKQLQRQVNVLTKLMKIQAPIIRGASGLMASVTNPSGTLESMLLGLSARIPIIGLGTGAGVGLAETIYGMVNSEYAPGAVKDPRVQMTDQTKSYLGTEKDDLLYGGNQLFLGDPRTHKGVLNTTSNTQNLSDGMRRYNLRTNGYGR